MANPLSTHLLLHLPLDSDEGVSVKDSDASPMSDLSNAGVDSLGDDDGDDHSHGDDHKVDVGGNSVAPYYRRNRAADRARLINRIKFLVREINKPLAEVVRYHVLPRLPARSILRLRAVASSWAQLASSPLFVHTHPQTHRSVSGVFFLTFPGYPPAYAPFLPASAHAIPDPALSFIPDSPISVLCSSNGLLLCRSHFSGALFVCNPITAAWTAVPQPPIKTVNSDNPAAVLIFVPDVYNFRPDFTIVIAFQVANSGFFGFEVFSSTAGDWWVSNKIWEAERLFPSSGVAAGKVAYWRTSMSTVIGYEPAADRVLVVPWPMGHKADVNWEIGVMGGSGRLYSVSVTNTDVEVHKLVSESEGWAFVDYVDVNKWRKTEEEAEYTDDRQAEGELRPWPLRFQSGEMEFLLWFSGKIVGINLASKQVRVAEAAGETPGIYGSKYVSYVSTLSPVPPSAEGRGTEESAGDDRRLGNGTW